MVKTPKQKILFTLLLTETVFIPTYVFLLTYRNVYSKEFEIGNDDILLFVSVFAFSQVIANLIHLLLVRKVRDNILLVSYNSLTTFLTPLILLVSPSYFVFFIASILLGFGNATQSPFQSIANYQFNDVQERNDFYLRYSFFTKIGILLVSVASYFLFDAMGFSISMVVILAAFTVFNLLAVVYRYIILKRNFSYLKLKDVIRNNEQIEKQSSSKSKGSVWRSYASILQPVIINLIIYYGLSRTFDSFNSNYLNLYLVEVVKIPESIVASLQTGITSVTIIITAVLLYLSKKYPVKDYTAPLMIAMILLLAAFSFLSMPSTTISWIIFVLAYSLGTSISWPYTQSYFNHAIPKDQLSYMLSIRNILAQIISFAIFALISTFDNLFQLKESLDNYLLVNYLIIAVMIGLLALNYVLHVRANRSLDTVKSLE